MITKSDIKLKDVCNIIMGQSPESSSYNQQGIGIPFFQGCSDFGEIHPSIRTYCSNPKKKANVDDILISVRAPIGTMNIADRESCIGRGIAAITPLETADKGFVYYLLQFNKGYLQSQGTGSTFKAIGKTALENMPVPNIPLKRQKAIGTEFRLIDRVLANQRRQLTLLDDSVKSRFNELVAGTNIIVPAEDLCSDIVDCPHSTPKYTGIDLKYPSIRTTDINNGQINWTTMKYVDHREYLERTRRLVPQPGDIVYSREGSYGDCVIIPENIEMCLGQRTMLFRPNRKKVTSEYMEEALRSEDVKKQADKNNTGSTVPHVNVKDAKRFLIPLVDLGSQEDFSGFVNQVNKSKLAIQKSIGELETLKKKLMQEYFG